jgi:BioD-like phosphotransacetylase family protein
LITGTERRREMATLYVASLEDYSGKSALCIGLGTKFVSYGLTVGYMKPIATTTTKWMQGRLISEDAQFMKQVLDLKEPLDVLTPVGLDPALESIIEGEADLGFEHRVKAAFKQVARGKDVVIVEGARNLMEGAIVGLPASKVARLLRARVLVVARYTHHSVIDELAAAQMLLGGSLLGAVINVVPRQQLPYIEEVAVPFLERSGIKVLAVLPEDKVLHSISVQDLVEALGGRVLCCPQMTGELVENLMVGAMTVDSAIEYFQRTMNKAVITGGDRSDIQLAALETSTRCLVLTGDLEPSPFIVGRAEEERVPVVLVPHDTLRTVEIIEGVFGKTRFCQEKIQRFIAMLDKRFDFATLYKGLGLRG